MLTKERILALIAVEDISSNNGNFTFTEICRAMDDYARQVAIDFHDWQKKDQAECLADMSTEDYFDKYLKTKQ